jgi:hypothetical protein
MTSRLSSLLVQDGLVSAKRMADAFQRQVIYGGTLDTNLLEMRVIEEDVLLAYLGRASGLPTQPAGITAMGRPSAKVLAAFPKDVAERFRAVPCESIEDGVLRVLVADPVEPQDMEALAQTVRQRIEPWIVPEFRLMEAMEVVYGEAVPPRYQRLVQRSKQAHEGRELPPPRIIDPVPRFGNLHEFRLDAGPAVEDGKPDRQGPKTSAELWISAYEEAQAAKEQPASAEPPAGPEPVPELIPEQSAPVVPVKIAPQPAPAPAQVVQPPQPVMPHGSGKKKKRGRRGESPRVPPPAPIVAKPVITPRAAEPPRAQAEAPRIEPPPKVVVEPSVIVSDLPSEVRAPVIETRTPSGPTPAVARRDEGAPSPRLTAEHTPLPTPAPPPSELSGPNEPVPVPIDSGRLGEHLVYSAVAAPRETPRVAVAIGEPRTEPLSFQAAQELIANAEERDLIFEALCRAARSRVAFAAVFTVHGDVAFGRLALAEGWLDRDGLSKVAVPLDRPSAFRIAVKGRSPHLGRIGEQPAAGEALSALGRRPPVSGAVLPVLVRGRPLALLSIDDGGREITGDLLEEMRPLMVEVSQAFQRLVLRSRAGGFSGAAPEEGGRERGQVENEMLTPTTSAWRGRERERDKRSTLTRVSAHGDAAAKVIEVRDPPPAAKAEPAEAVPQRSTEQPTNRMRPGRSQAEPTPVPTPVPTVVKEAQARQAAEARPARPLPTLSELVSRAASGDGKAAEQLLAEGEDAARAVVMALPGTLKSRERQALGDPIGEPVQRRGPLLALAPRFGKAAIQPLLERLENPVTPPEVRYYVALCFTEMPVKEAIRPLGHRLFDADDTVRMAAVSALRCCPSGPEMRDLLEMLRSDLLGPEPRRQQHAVEALGELRDVESVPRMIQLLGSPDLLLASAAARALQTVTKQDYGRSRLRWRLWWRKHHDEPRLQWMLLALGHQNPVIRASAQDELRGLCGDVVGYRFDHQRREREAAQRRWVEWWQRRGYPVYVP